MLAATVLPPVDTLNNAHDVETPIGEADPDDLSIAPDLDDDHGVTEGDHPDTMDNSISPFGNPVDATPIAGTRLSGRNRKLTQCYIEAMEQHNEGIVAFIASHAAIDPLWYQEDKDLQQFEADPIAFALKATSNLDTMYYHQAMKEPDAKQFKCAMTKEVDTHIPHGKETLGDRLPRSGPLWPSLVS
jgi:hypothetical protein